MGMRAWLRHTDQGWEAWSLDFLGFATFAETEDAVLQRFPVKLEEYLLWRDVHGLPAPHPGYGVEVVERVERDEELFSPDREPAAPADVDTALQLLDCSRRDLLPLLAELPDEVLDWDPPYRRFAEWAHWRTIRQILVHLANTESHYYLPQIGIRPPFTAAQTGDDWHVFLPRSRGHTVIAMQALKASADRTRVTENAESWSVRKVLRRLVRHELLHTTSIRRIIATYDEGA